MEHSMKKKEGITNFWYNKNYINIWQKWHVFQTNIKLLGYIYVMS